MQHSIRRNYANRCNVGYIQPLGYHLRAYQRLRFAAHKPIKYFIMRVLALRSVVIHPERGHAGKLLLKLLLHLLRTNAEVFKIRLAALRAFCRYSCRAAAVMAFHNVFVFVICHGYIAIGTFERISTPSAGYKR